MTQQRIALLSQFFPPETAAPANRLGAIAEACSRIGSLTVVTTAPSYPTPDAYSAIDVSELDRQRRYSIHRTGPFSAHTGGFVIRGVRELLLAIRLGSIARRLQPRIVIASSPSMFLGPAGFIVARSIGAHFVWDIRDITWGYAAENPTSSHLKWLANIVGLLMRAVFRRADLVIVTNAGSAAVVQSQGAVPDKVRVVANGIAPEVLESITATAAIPNRDDGATRVTYVGLLGMNQGLETLIEAVKMTPNVRVTFVGDGPSRAQLERTVEMAGVSNVEFRGFVDRATVYRLYSDADILFAKLSNAPMLNETAVPSKLYEYMATGKPIIYAGRGVAADLIRDVGCGVVVEPDDSRGIARTIYELAENRILRTTLGQRGAAWVQANARRDVQMQQFAAAVEALI